jgi:hypothetical protein
MSNWMKYAAAAVLSWAVFYGIMVLLVMHRTPAPW